LNGPDGKPLRAGLRGKTASGTGFAVGYDGRAYIEGLDPQNAVTVALEGGECHAEFPYGPGAKGQTVIGPVACR
jgi:outer membrane usher protein